MVWCFSTNIPQDLCTDLKSHSPCVDCRDDILSELYTVIAAQLASQAQRLGRSIHLLNPLRQEHRVVGDPSGTTRKVETLMPILRYTRISTSPDKDKPDMLPTLQGQHEWM